MSGEQEKAWLRSRILRLRKMQHMQAPRLDTIEIALVEQPLLHEMHAAVMMRDRMDVLTQALRDEFSDNKGDGDGGTQLEAATP